MSSVRQKRVAKLIIENTNLDEPKTGGEIVESSGYGVSMKKNPQVVLNSDGVKEELEILGFTEHNAKTVVTEILLNTKIKPETRINAAKEVFKVHGSYAPDKSVNININQKSIDPTDPKVLEALKTINKQRANEQ